MTRRTPLSLAVVALCVLASCTNDDTTTGTTAPDGSLPADMMVTADASFPSARCEANKAAGKITYLSGFDFAATASIVDVLVADSKGYYDDLCLDVDVVASFSTENYPLVAANEAQFASAGSFSEMVDFAGANDAGFVALSVEGRTGIDALITKGTEITTLADIKGKKIGVKGAITSSVKAMLAQEGLVEGEDYETVLLDGFDPLVHIEYPGIVGFPGYKSNEPLQLEGAGVPITVYDPADYDIPGSFGVIYTNSTFATEHPTATQDFIRATMRGLADAIDDPEAAAQVAVDLLNANGNAMFLSLEGELARWGVESQLVDQDVTATAPLGVPQLDLLTAELTAYASIGLFDGTAPDASAYVDDRLLAELYADGTLIWPTS